MLPFEFTVLGPPVSQQARRRERLREWQRIVRRAAERSWPATSDPVEFGISMVITYYYETSTPDLDNIIKPIQDALIGLIYQDDSQVTDVRARKRSIEGSFRVSGMSSVLAEAFVAGQEFLHVWIGFPPDHEEIER